MQDNQDMTPESTMPAAGNMENYFDYSIMQWDSVSHVLTLGIGVFAAALIYFLGTMRYVDARFRLSNMLSAVVMVSAMLILIRQAVSWDLAFVVSESGRMVPRDNALFSNGYRYMNWSIDVPVLLVQMLIVLPLAARVKISRAIQFIVAGLGMIWTSWVAQFYETGGIIAGTTAAPFWIWYVISWAFYIWIIAIVWKTITEGKRGVPERAQKVLTAILWLLLISWTAYGLAIVLPQIWWDAGSGVARQYIFTFADIFSKVVYGVLLGWVATIRSAAPNDTVDDYPDELAVLTPLKD